MAEWQLVLILFVVLGAGSIAFNSWFYRSTLASLTQAKATHLPNVKIWATTKGSYRGANYDVYLVEGAVLFSRPIGAGLGRPFCQINKKANRPRKFDAVWVYVTATQVREEDGDVIITYERGLLSTKLRFKSLSKKQRAQVMMAMGKKTKSQLRTTAKNDLQASLDALDNL